MLWVWRSNKDNKNDEIISKYKLKNKTKQKGSWRRKAKRALEFKFPGPNRLIMAGKELTVSLKSFEESRYGRNETF